MNLHWGRVRALLADAPASPETLALGVVACTRMLHNTVFLGPLGVDASVLFVEGMELAARLEDPAPRVILLVEYGAARVSAGAMDEGLARLSEGVALADRSGDPFLRFMARAPFVSILLPAGRLRESVASAAEAEALSGGNPGLGADISGFSSYCLTLATRGAATAWLGRPLDGARVVEQAIEIARQRRDAEAAVHAHTLAVHVHEILGDADAGLQHPRQAVEIAEATGSGLFRANALDGLARAHILKGQWAEAAEAADGALTIVRGRRVGLSGESRFLASLAHARLGTGHPDQARAAAESAVALARERGVRLLEIRALLARARVRLATEGAPARARVEADLRDAAALIDATEARAYAPGVNVERAELARVVGDEVGRQRELHEAHRLFTAMGAAARAEEVAKETAR
jgi:tetratricopeptide (TPR) repeat protein